MVIAGLGNPGKRYSQTRHNVGFEAIEHLAKSLDVQFPDKTEGECVAIKVPNTEPVIWLVKPQQFMNHSVRSLKQFCKYHKLEPEKLIVIYDEINLDLGKTKISNRRSAGGHNGMKDILSYFPEEIPLYQYRIGVGHKKHPEMDLADHVLSKFDSKEQELFSKSLPTFTHGIKLILAEGIERAMNLLN